MKTLNKNGLTIAIIATSVFLIIILTSIITKANENKALQIANESLDIILSDQIDNSLINNTVIKVKSRAYICIDNKISNSKDDTQASTPVIKAEIVENGASVYLTEEDSNDVEYKTSSNISYEKLIDPNDKTIKTYTYSQVNTAAQKFLDEVSYEDVEDTASEITKYLDTSNRYDRPAGCTVNLEAGDLTVYDNGTKKSYTVKVKKGPYTFYNITPGVGGEFFVIKNNKVVQKGHLRPTGTLRMIYSDTPGLQNMRDLGGWPCDGGTIKYNMLIRGGQVIDATDTDRNTWVKLLGIEHDVFVKTYYESQLKGKEEYATKSPLGDNVKLYQKDLSAENSENKRNFTTAKEQMNGIINRLFDNAIAGETTYFHCLAGADRTGMIAIIVEGVLGVSKNNIDKDYELTSFNCLRERNSDGYIADINILRSYPGNTFRDNCVNYLLDCGITIEKINEFRNAVIDGEPEKLTENGLDVIPEGTNLCIHNGEGWIDDGRSSNKGEDRFDAKGSVLTNYFAIQNGDTVYVKNLKISPTMYSGIYNSDKTAITGFVMTEADGKGIVKDILCTNEWTVFTIDNEEAGFLRLCGIPKAEKSDIIINIYRNGEWLILDK